MKKVSVRRAAPWLMAASALAIFPLDGVVTATVTVASSSSASEQTVSRLTRDHSIHALSDVIAASQAASSSASASRDGVQVPHRGGQYHVSNSARAASGLAVPIVTPTSVSGNSGAVHSFAGLDNYQQRYLASGGNQFTFTPPDQGMCVGNGYVLESVNDALRVYNTTGKALTPPIGANAFFGYPPVINRTTFEFGPEPTDPSCYFDSQYQRWFQVYLTLDVNRHTGALTLVNHLDIAVSASSSPLGGWVFYHIAATDDGTQGTPVHRSCPCIGDYPHIGADQFGFYVTTNEYPWLGGPGTFGNAFNGAQVYALSKFNLAQNSAHVTMVHKAHLALANGTPSFTLWPSQVPGTAYDARHGGSEWFSQSTAAIQETNNPAGMSDNIAVWRLSNTQSLDSSHPSLTIFGQTLSSEVYGVPPPSEQKVGPVPLRDCLVSNCLPGIGPSKSESEGPLDSNDSRMQSAWLAGGQLFTALDTIVSVNGRYQAGVAFFIVNPAEDIRDSTITSQGYEAVAGNITYPSIATRADGTGAMAITLVGSSYYPSAAYMTVGPSGPTGSVIIAKRGAGPDDEFCQYLFYNCGQTPTPSIRPRWGDYGMAQVMGTQVWIASEYIGQTCTITQYVSDPTCGGTRAVLSNWGTRITQVTP